ncbi:MAG: hypothetical protein ACOCYN_00725 [Planctomycetota bacterium]
MNATTQDSADDPKAAEQDADSQPQGERDVAAGQVVAVLGAAMGFACAWRMIVYERTTDAGPAHYRWYLLGLALFSLLIIHFGRSWVDEPDKRDGTHLAILIVGGIIALTSLWFSGGWGATIGATLIAGTVLCVHLLHEYRDRRQGAKPGEPAASPQPST